MRSHRSRFIVVALLVAATLLGAASAALAEPTATNEPTVQAAPATNSQTRMASCIGPDIICAAGTAVSNADELVGLTDDVLGTAASSGLESLASSTFGAIAQHFGEAGVAFLKSLAGAFVESTAVDLDQAGIEPIMAIATPIAMLVAVLLVVIAAGRAAVSGNGSVIATALVGVAKTALVTVLIVAVAQAALYASDALSHWIIEASLGDNEGLEERLGALITLTALSNSPALVLLFGVLAIVVSFILWVELLFRRVAIVLLIALAPIAAAGQVLGETGEWWTKARTALIQLILLKPVIALCFAIGFSAFGAAEDLTGVIAGFVTLGLAVVAWPLLARFMTFTSVGGGHAAVSGLIGSAAGFLAGRRTGGSPSSGPAATAGGGYTLALERENDASVAGSRGSGSSVGAGAKALATRTKGAGALAAVGAAATAGAAVFDHVESQMTGAAADSGLGHATRPYGTHGHTPGRFRGRHAAPPAYRSAPSTTYADPSAGDRDDDETAADRADAAAEYAPATPVHPQEGNGHE